MVNKHKPTSSGWLFDPIFPNAEDWPIMQLAKDRPNFLEEVENYVFENVKAGFKSRQDLNDELANVLYQEKIRLKTNLWKADPKDEKPFWKGVEKKLLDIQSPVNPQGRQSEEEILREIVHRYVHEIAGNFDLFTYNITKTLVTQWMSRLLNAGDGKGISGLWNIRRHLHDRIHLLGEVELIRKLAKTDTIIMVPTHFSNLDSPLIGWAIQSLGLPPFLYGAGLNLFGIGIFGYFMEKLGAYKVDRRKKNSIYLEALKAYSTLSMHRGCHSLFFPGGTRSRSGAIESKLKLGLLGTALEAQRLNFEKAESPEKAKRIFVVPVVINYNFVLEAPGLIEEHLKRSGQQRYFRENDHYSTSYQLAWFIFKLFFASSEMALTFGRPTDLFGNEIDDEGNSLDQHGRRIDIEKYFFSNQTNTQDLQRDAEYTKLLGKDIVKKYKKYNYIYPSHLVAYVAFEMMRKKYKKLDLYSFLRLEEENESLPGKEFQETVELFIGVLKQMRDNGKCMLDVRFDALPIERIIELGIRHLGLYNTKRPLKIKENGEIVTEDFTLLYFYHNRMEGYGLSKLIQ
ncbi:MAG: 1-acyl-sn-glycerol-3-phosphate acyltransferase [Bacteroidia bacterium]|nr:1-acyl-sn-glycerol-3-phosphate acyltransferase [Bacteroidia bacterium]